jgi:hypothetical protein
MSIKKRHKSIIKTIRIDSEMDIDLKIIYGIRKLAMKKESGEDLGVNEFFNDIFMEYISRNSDSVRIVRNALEVKEGVEESKGI